MLTLLKPGKRCVPLREVMGPMLLNSSNWPRKLDKAAQRIRAEGSGTALWCKLPMMHVCRMAHIRLPGTWSRQRAACLSCLLHRPVSCP